MRYSFLQLIVSLIILAILGIGFGILPLPQSWTKHSQLLQQALPTDHMLNETEASEHIVESAEINGESYTDLDILRAVNRERAKFNIAPLVLSLDLERSARQKVTDMVTHTYFAHEREGVLFEDFIKEENYDYVIIGENLARGEFKSTERLVRAWLSSPTHRKNILDARYKETGIAILAGTYDDQSVYYIAEHFGTPRSICLQVLSSNATSELTLLQQTWKEREAEVVSLKRTLTDLGEAGTERTKLLQLYQQKMTDLASIQKTLFKKIEGEESLIQSYNNCIQSYQE